MLESRERLASWRTEFATDDALTLTYKGSYELLQRPFEISRGVTLPVGGYSFDDIQLSYNPAPRRPVRANLWISRGTFYSGHKTTFGGWGGRVRVSNQISLEPSYTFNRVELVEGDFTTHLLSTRATYTMTPAMFVSALFQYSSSGETVLTNARLRWEYQPGSELFVVYNEQRDTLTPSFPDLQNRALIIKLNRLFRF